MVAGGEGVRARGQEATESYLGRVGFGLGAAGRRLAGEQGEAAAVASGGGGAPVTGSGWECAMEVRLDLVKLFGGSSCTDSARMKEFTARVSTAAFVAAASGVPSELRATCMGKSGV